MSFLPPEIREYMRAQGLMDDEPITLAASGPVTVNVTEPPEGSAVAPAQPAEPEPTPPASPQSAGILIDPQDCPDYLEPPELNYLFNVWPRLRRPLVILTGPRGTGKTLAAEVWAFRNGHKLLKVEADPQMEPEQLLGAPRISSGTDYWQDGPLTIAARLSAAGQKVLVFIDEFSLFSPQCQAKLNCITDRIESGFTIPYTGERVQWNQPRILLAANEGYAGTRGIQEALRDRGRTLETVYLREADEINLLVNRTGLVQDIAERAVQCANAIRAAARGDDTATMPLEFDFSFRALEDFAEAHVHGQDLHESWRQAVLGRVGNSFREEAARNVVIQLSRTGGMLPEEV